MTDRKLGRNQAHGAPYGFEAQVGATNARAPERDFSRDGCRTDADMRYRRDMLRNVANGVQSGAVLTRERAWKA